MKIYIECKMGAAGDMLMAALYELLEESQRTEFIGQMNAVLGPDIRVSARNCQMAGITGTHMQVEIFGQEEHVHMEHAHEELHHHEHRSYASILEQLQALALPPAVRFHAGEIYRLIGEAEARVHGTDLAQIHFHEVGSLDALADVVGVCLLMAMLAPEQVIVSPIHVGNGTVRCAHGILPVPAPATAELLAGIPFYTGSVDTELCTPTGAAILKHFAGSFGPVPEMTVSRIGYGFGTKELPVLNAVRAFLGETAACGDCDQILDISCNLDDMTGEALGYAMEVLLSAGALDVFYVPVQMKKNRPGILLHCFCAPERQEDFIRLLFRHTTTRGVRYQLFDRKKLTSRLKTVESSLGPVVRKVSEGYGIVKAKYEYEDLRRIAGENGLSLQELIALLTEGAGSPPA